MKEKELKLDQLDKVTGGTENMQLLTCPHCGKNFTIDELVFHEGDCNGYCPHCGGFFAKFYI